MLNFLMNILFSKPKSKTQVSSSLQKNSAPKLEMYGLTSATCPACKTKLEKFPGRKKKCQHCGEFMYVRTRPLDKQRILLTEKQLDKHNEQQAIEYGTYDDYKAEQVKHEQDRQHLKAQFGGVEPSENDLNWYQLNKKVMSEANSGDWGGYAITRTRMGDQLSSEGKYEGALQMYMMSAAIWCSDLQDMAEIILPPTLLRGINTCMNTLDLSKETLTKSFDDACKDAKKDLRAKINMTKSRKILLAELGGF